MDGVSDCIFCQIVAGDAPATVIAEGERAIAFMDVNPTTPGHALVIPRSHASDLLRCDPLGIRDTWMSDGQAA